MRGVCTQLYFFSNFLNFYGPIDDECVYLHMNRANSSINIMYSPQDFNQPSLGCGYIVHPAFPG